MAKIRLKYIISVCSEPPGSFTDLALVPINEFQERPSWENVMSIEPKDAKGLWDRRKNFQRVTAENFYKGSVPPWVVCWEKRRYFPGGSLFDISVVDTPEGYIPVAFVRYEDYGVLHTYILCPLTGQRSTAYKTTVR